ncbi:hypothetical protein LPUS_07915, partial [Lasallia pustulata]
MEHLVNTKDIDDGKYEAAIIATASVDEINSEARKAFEAEHALSFRTAAALYKPAVGWSLFFAL